jgi:peroxiredoxin Q/BCP
MKLLKKGEKVPEFTATDESGNQVKLSDFRGRKLIIFFYPRANTPGCTEEACNLRDNYTALKAKGFALLGVSEDSMRKQANFKKKYNLPFPLLADTEHEVIDSFGVWGPKKFMGREFDGIHRTTFVIDEKGIVENVIEKVITKDHAAQLLGE